MLTIPSTADPRDRGGLRDEFPQALVDLRRVVREDQVDEIEDRGDVLLEERGEKEGERREERDRRQERRKRQRGGEILAAVRAEAVIGLQENVSNGRCSGGEAAPLSRDGPVGRLTLHGPKGI